MPGEWTRFCVIAFAVALVRVLRGRQVLRPGRRRSAAVAGVIALVTWYAPEVHGRWSAKAGSSVLWALAGTVLLLVIVVECPGAVFGKGRLARVSWLS